jgi:hypothetical protein
VALIEVLETNLIHGSFSKPWYFLAILTSVEVVIIIVSLLWYLSKISYVIKSFIFKLFFC